MSKITYDNIRKIAKAEIDLIESIDESKIYTSKGIYGFAIDITDKKTFGNDAYFKVYQMQGKMQVKKNNVYVAARVYFTKPYYFTHNNEPEPTILWNFSSKDKRNINSILLSPAFKTVNMVKGISITDDILNSLTTYQYLIFIFDKLNKEIRGIPYSDIEILTSSIANTPVSAYFIPIDYPMPDYSTMQLKK